MKEKTLLSHKVVCFQMLDFGTSNSNSTVSKFKNNYFFLDNYITSEEAISHNVLYYQPLPITLYQVRFSANNYFEVLSIVSTAFKSNKYFKSSLRTILRDQISPCYHLLCRWQLSPLLCSVVQYKHLYRDDMIVIRRLNSQHLGSYRHPMYTTIFKKKKSPEETLQIRLST